MPFFILMGVGTCGFKKKNHFCVGCTFLLDFFLVYFFLESSTATCETMELKKPRDLYQLIVLFVNLYK